ncbi:hypothetical protein EIP86_005552 [Pleurotus ostreatoroseus]|nr:hypothetical protein EIP86_005552 [Pleurotus ostreatoroseus]
MPTQPVPQPAFPSTHYNPPGDNPIPGTIKGGHTPVHASTSGTTLMEHDRSSVHVYIREDIKQSQRVSLDVFVATVFRLTKQRMDEWVGIIGKEKWHEDEEISAALETFCTSTTESSRYEPLSNMANRVVRMAPGRLPDVPDVYPIDDICAKRNDPNCIQPIKAHGGLGARRSPDCLILRERDAVKIPAPPSAAAKAKDSTDAEDPPSTENRVLPPLAMAPRRGRGTAARASVATRHSTRRMATRATTKTAAAAVMTLDPLPEDDPAVTHKDDSNADTTTGDAGARDDNQLQRVRWVDVIMSVELKGKATLRKLWQLFLKDRSRSSSTPTGVESRGSHGRGRGARGGRGGRGVRGGHMHSRGRQRGRTGPTTSTDVPVSGSRKRRREDNEDDDLIQHIRRPDPPTCTLKSSISTSSQSETPEKLSYDVKKASIQTGSYALETLACTFGTRLFCVNILVKNDRLYFWYYDACGFIYTESISIVEDFEKLAAILVAIACSTPAQLGALPAFIKPPQHAPYPQNWPPESLKDHSLTIPRALSVRGRQTVEQIHVTLQDPVFTHYVLAGRRTFVYAVKTSPSLSKTELIAKFSYQVSTRRQEHELIDIARQAGIDHLPEVHAWGEHWKMSDSVRSVFLAEAGAEFEDRTLRSIVYSKYLPLESLFSHSPQHIPTMAYQLIDCVHNLRYKANILHRDISANNVMYEYRDSKLYFILIDFDMATVLAEDYVPSSKHRTGTLAFMAVELIRDAIAVDNPGHLPITHMLCHDLESIYWLCLWCAMVLVIVHDAMQRKKLLDAVRGWETQELWIIAHYKRSLRSEPLDVSQIHLPQAAIDANLDSWFWSWTRIWMQYERVLGDWRLDCRETEKAGLPGPAPFEHETAGGVLTRDNLLKHLTNAIPDRSNDTVNPNAPDVETSIPPDTTAAVGATVLRDVFGSPAQAPSSKATPEGVAVRPTENGTVKTKKSKANKTKRRKGKTTSIPKQAVEANNKKRVTSKRDTKKKAAPALTVLDKGKEDENDIRRRLRPRKQ